MCNEDNEKEHFYVLACDSVCWYAAWIAALLLNRVKHKFEPKRRSAEEILEGIKTV